MTVLAITLSLIAAFLFAIASVLQAKGTQGLSDDEALGAGFLFTLARRKTWVAGLVADILAFVVQAAALAVGSLMLVQPLLVTTLLFALPLAAMTARRRLTAREWFWAGALTISLVVFIALGQPSEGIEHPPFSAWIVPLAVVIPVVAVCVIVGSRLPHGTWRSLTLAVAAGVLLGISAPLTKTGIAAFEDGLLAGARSWEFWAMALTATLGTLWQQSSYQAGDVQTSLPTVTVLKPIIAMALGLTIYQETLGIDSTGDILVIVALSVMILATIMLGRLSAPESDPDPTPQRSATVEVAR
ncbi:DMT family transporter [Gordonia sp. NPDC003376]